MTQEDARTAAFRCAITPDNSSATIKVGRRRISVSLVEVSRVGFTVRMPLKVARRISTSKTYLLTLKSEIWEVQKEADRIQGDASDVRFVRVRERTKIKLPKNHFGYLIPRFDPRTDPELLLFLMLAFITAIVSLPGIGDNLGTAPRVRKGVQTIWHEVGRVF